jgi:hypothetical protein
MKPKKPAKEKLPGRSTAGQWKAQPATERRSNPARNRTGTFLEKKKPEHYAG